MPDTARTSLEAILAEDLARAASTAKIATVIAAVGLTLAIVAIGMLVAREKPRDSEGERVTAAEHAALMARVGSLEKSAANPLPIKLPDDLRVKNSLTIGDGPIQVVVTKSSIAAFSGEKLAWTIINDTEGRLSGLVISSPLSKSSVFINPIGPSIDLNDADGNLRCAIGVTSTVKKSGEQTLSAPSRVTMFDKAGNVTDIFPVR